MSIAIMVTDRDLTPLQQGLAKYLPNDDIKFWPNVSYDEEVDFVVAWQHPPEMWKMFPNLKAISSLGAGVDQLISDKNCAEQLIITRIVDKDLSEQMAKYCLTVLLMYQENLGQYINCQLAQRWQTLDKQTNSNVTILGAGEIGLTVAKRLYDNGFIVSTWSQSYKNEEYINSSYIGFSELYRSIKDADFVISILPATKQTNDLIDLSFLKQMQRHAVFVNVGRGNAVNEEHLLQALQTNTIAGATLDVFKEEPLPVGHPFWTAPNLQITPHISAVTSQDNVIKQIVENYQLLKEGKPLKHQVNLKKGY